MTTPRAGRAPELSPAVGLPKGSPSDRQLSEFSAPREAKNPKTVAVQSLGFRGSSLRRGSVARFDSTPSPDWRVIAPASGLSRSQAPLPLAALGDSPAVRRDALLMSR